MSHALANKTAILHDRAMLFQKARHFFATRNVLEVDVPLLTQKAPIDEHIDLVEALCMGKKSYLQSSPEYGMKRLLADGIGDIYQISHVFRDGERGARHNPEFVMVEWYRIDFSFEEMIKETVDFLRLFLDVEECETLTYEESFQKYAKSYPEEERELLFALKVEPELGRDRFTILRDFPPEEAALSKIREIEGKSVAMRFEIFYKGFELANGYHELTDPVEQRKRLEEANAYRKKAQKPTYPLDTYFIEALEKGLPDMCGVAVGFDRLMMLRHLAKNIEEVIPFAWEEV